MRTLLSEVRRLHLAHGNHINSIEKKGEQRRIIQEQLNSLYARPGVQSLIRIEKLERKLSCVKY